MRIVLIFILFTSPIFAESWVNSNLNLSQQRAANININPGGNAFNGGGFNLTNQLFNPQNSQLSQLVQSLSLISMLGNNGSFGGAGGNSGMSKIIGILQIVNLALNMVQTLFGGQQIAQNPVLPNQTLGVNCQNLQNVSMPNVRMPDGSMAPNGGIVSNLPRPPQGIIVHSSTVNAGLNGAINNGYRYNYGIDRSGNVYLLVPNGYAQHIKPGDAPQRTGRNDLSNSNTISITLLDTDNDMDGVNKYDPSIPHKTVPATNAQLQSFHDLTANLKKQFPSITGVYGHGEIQNDRHGLEGIDAAQIGKQLVNC